MALFSLSSQGKKAGCSIRDFVSANPFIVLSHCSVFLKIELLFGGHFSLEFSHPPPSLSNFFLVIAFLASSFCHLGIEEALVLHF